MIPRDPPSRSSAFLRHDSEPEVFGGSQNSSADTYYNIGSGFILRGEAHSKNLSVVNGQSKERFQVQTAYMLPFCPDSSFIPISNLKASTIAVNHCSRPYLFATDLVESTDASVVFIAIFRIDAWAEPVLSEYLDRPEICGNGDGLTVHCTRHTQSSDHLKRQGSLYQLSELALTSVPPGKTPAYLSHIPYLAKYETQPGAPLQVYWHLNTPY